MYRGMVFDLDGTLYDYDECDRTASARLESACCVRFDIGADTFRTLYGRAKARVKSHLGAVAASHNRLLYIQVLLEELGRKQMGDALELYDIYWDAMLECMRPYDYVLPYFQYLKRNGIKIGILTDLTAHIQHRKLRTLGIMEYVDCLVTSEEAGAEKPSPQMFGLVLEKLALKPGEVCMIGDSVVRDIAGAEKNGIHGMLLSREMCDDTECSILRKLLAVESAGLEKGSWYENETV